MVNRPSRVGFIPDYRVALWDWFAEDDGSLPECAISGLAKGESDIAVERILAHASDSPRYAHVDKQGHFVVPIRFHGQVIPELGIVAGDEMVELDWRMGPQWTHDAIEAFFALMYHAIEDFAHAVVVPEEGVMPEAEHAFRKAWLQFLSAQV